MFSERTAGLQRQLGTTTRIDCPDREQVCHPGRHPEPGLNPLDRFRPDTHRGRVQGIYDRYRGYVSHVLRRVGVEPSLLEDAIQDVFVLVAADRSLAQRAHERLWLVGICRNVARVYRRERSRWRDLHPPEALLNAPHGTELEELYALREARDWLGHFLIRLHPKQRAMFELSELGELSGAAAADRLGINVHTAYARLRVARASFARQVRTIQLREQRPVS